MGARKKKVYEQSNKNCFIIYWFPMRTKHVQNEQFDVENSDAFHDL